MLTCASADTHLDTKQWLETTRKLISHYDVRMLEHAEENLIWEMTAEIVENLKPALLIRLGKSELARLGKIFASALKLFRLLHRQSARFYVEMAPAVENEVFTTFNASFMQDLGIEDEDALRDRVIGISVWPAIWKTGDEQGQNVSSFAPLKSVMTTANIIICRMRPKLVCVRRRW